MVLGAAFKPVGFVYAFFVVVVLAYLWHSGRWRQWAGWLLLIVSAALGFLIFSPLMPYQFQQLVLRDVEGLGGPLIIGAVGLAFMFLLSLAFGRFVCGYACPVGAVQEIAYYAPVRKVQPRQKVLFMGIRWIFFALFLAMALLFSASLLAYFGIHDFFHLALTAGSLAFLIILAVSTVFYRPFCRLACPYGAVLSLGAAVSPFRLRRTGACIACGKCEKACPADEAKKDDAKAECYLCGRCTQACPNEALVYSAKRAPEGDGNK